MIGLLLGLAMAEPCVTTCVMPATTESRPLDPDVVDDLVDAVIAEPEVDALDTLVFHADQVLEQLSDRVKPAPDWLIDELQRSRVDVAFRLVDDTGALRGRAQRSLRSGTKQHVPIVETGSLGELEANGRVRRVGVNHLWARF